MPHDHIEKFWSCYPNPPNQPAVGDSPQLYLTKLNSLCELDLAWPAEHPQGTLTRTQLRSLCRDTNIHVLIAYASVMAWGGRGVDSRNYRLSLTEPSHSALTAILLKLRDSNAERDADFAAMQEAAKNIKGLGISFYTKLLFFMRKNPDAYILDQFTAKSVKLLFERCQVILNSSGYPAPDNSPNAYQWFCNACETMAQGRAPLSAWSGEQVEQAMFNVRGGAWRNYLRSIYGKVGASKSKQVKLTADSPVLGFRSLPKRVAIAHAAAYKDGRELPGATPQVNNQKRGHPVRVHCSRIGGVDWQYAFNKSLIHAEVFIPAQRLSSYDELRSHLAIPDHDFGDGITGNGAKNGSTRSIKFTIRSGLKAPENEWDVIAQQAVAAMATLFERVSEIV